MTIEHQRAECWLTDMDGVLVHEEHALPGAAEFIARLIERERRFLVLTNNSIFTPRDLAARFDAPGLDVPEAAIWTSALATADFLPHQKPEGSAYVIGEAGLTTALHEIGYTLTDHRCRLCGCGRDPDIELFLRIDRTRNPPGAASGARFIATNPDVTSPSPEGPLPATGSVAAMIAKATGAQPYFVGKPNPMMFRSAMNRIDARSETHRR